VAARRRSRPRRQRRGCVGRRLWRRCCQRARRATWRQRAAADGRVRQAVQAHLHSRSSTNTTCSNPEGAEEERKRKRRTEKGKGSQKPIRNAQSATAAEGICNSSAACNTDSDATRGLASKAAVLAGASWTRV